MIKKFKTLLGVGTAVVATTVFNPQDVKAKTHNLEIPGVDFDETAAIQSIDDSLFYEQVTSLENLLNEKFKEKLLASGFDKIQIILSKEIGQEKGFFQINFGTIIIQDGASFFDISKTLSVSVDGFILLNKYAAEELLSGIIAKELSREEDPSQG